MLRFNVVWDIRSEERSLDEKTRCGFWMYKLNADWKMKCICEQNKQRNPDFIEIYRKSLFGEIMITGTIEIYEDIEDKHQCLLKKRFISLLEDGCLFTRIDFQYPHNGAKYSPKVFFMTGKINISARLEASADLTELVHMTNTDYSSLKQLSKDLEKLLLEKSHLSDTSVKCGAVSIPAHKSILLARSPVFDAMLSCPLKDMENGIVLQDFEAPALQAMIEYVYTGRTGRFTPSLATNLLFRANKYQIASLESSCSRYLMRHMTMENVAIVLGIGVLISPDLKNFAIDFVCNKCTDYSALERSKDWIDLKNNNPALALEIFSAIVRFQEQKLKTPTKRA